MSAQGQLRVLHVIDSLGYGGAEASIAAIAPHLAARDVDVTIACFAPRPNGAATLEGSCVQIHPIAAEGRSQRVRAVRLLINKTRVDLVHTSLFEAGLVGRLASLRTPARVVSSLVNTPYGSRGLRDPRVAVWKSRVAQTIDVASARTVTRFHAVAEHVADTMSRRLLVPRSRIDVVHRGRDPERLGRADPDRRARSRTRLGVDDSTSLVVAVARHEYSKGLDVLVQAVTTVRRGTKDVHVLVAGREGSWTNFLEREIRERELGEVVELIGPRDDVPDLIAAADLFVLPSRWEGLPNALIEAIAIGVPVVATDLPGVREILGDVDSLVPSDDPRSLGEAMTRALATPNPQIVERNHRRFLDGFTVDHAADGMRAFYERALDA
jgi:glycosyltransferase involved in cell wall biosynthesis